MVSYKGMNIVIVGMGRVGLTMVNNLSSDNHDIVVVDVDRSCVDVAVNRFDVKGVVGRGSEREVLLRAEVDKADFFIASTSRDELNIICCALAKKLGAKHTIARVRDPEYFQEMGNIRSELGLDLVFNPEFRTAQEIAQILRFPSAKSVEAFTNKQVKMVEFDITDNNPMIGKSIMDIVREYQCKVLFAVVKRNDGVFIPKGDFVINLGDIVHIFADETELAKFCKKLNIFKPASKSVFIVGGGKIAYYLAQTLCESGVKVKILEQNADRCKELSELLPKATILCGDGTDLDILKEEKLEKADACITLTGTDEENVIISLYAAQQKMAKVITKVDRHSILNLIGQLGLGTVLCPRDVIANHIIRFVKSHQGSLSNDGVNTYYKIHNSVEVLEFTITDNFEGLSIPLKKLKLKEGILIAGIIRCGEFILPTGDTSFDAGDNVLVVAAEKSLTDVSQILR
ncbi:MAG: Trk system potassium transporter TrkA [Clostridiales bacterium]|nr:Trk system potassium transporter TrkA [Clostridiales bacterium]